MMPYLGISPTYSTTTNNLKWTIPSPSRLFTCVVPLWAPVTKENTYQVTKLRRVSEKSNAVSYASHRTIKPYDVHEPSFWLEGSININTTLIFVDNGPALMSINVGSPKPLKIFWTKCLFLHNPAAQNNFNNSPRPPVSKTTRLSSSMPTALMLLLLTDATTPCWDSYTKTVITMLCLPCMVSLGKITFAVGVFKPTTIRVNMPVLTKKPITAEPACKDAQITPGPTDTTVRLMFSVLPVDVLSTRTPVSKPIGPRIKPANPSIPNILRSVPPVASAKNVTVCYVASKRSKTHRCGFWECRCCHEQVDVHRHRCFLQVEKTPAERRRDQQRRWSHDRIAAGGLQALLANDAAGLDAFHANDDDPQDNDAEESPPLHVLFDIESMQVEGRHVPNLVVAETEADDRPVSFTDPHDCLFHFLQWLETLTENGTQSLTVIAHNFKGCDSYPVIKELHLQETD